MPYYGLYIPVKGGVGGLNATPSGTNVAASTATGNAANSAASCGNVGAAAAATTTTNAPGAAAVAAAGGAGDQRQADSPYVFRFKRQAFDVLKMYKDARLREFENEDDAVKYAQTGFEVVQTRYADVKTSTTALEKAAFRAPSKQELIEFRKVIESGDYERVKTAIWDNPRYLVSSGDTPTTLKEGYRYNAMHVCAISKKPRIAELILQTVSDPKFVDLLTGKKNDQKMCKELCVNLLDYYLNIPEKGRSETPLHFAAKNGGVEMVEVLTSYAECKMTPNSDGLMPRDIVCSRVSQPAPELCKRITSLLEERFYVPVLRSMDSAIPPQIGQPFSANQPPNLSSDPLSPEVKIQALAGPMKKEQAQQFCRRWKTPPRLGSTATTPVANSPFISPMKTRVINSTPKAQKTPHANDNSTHDSPTALTLQRRLDFNTTPQRSLSHNGSTLEDANAEADTSLIDKQNGNHKLGETAADDGANTAAYPIEPNNNKNDSQLSTLSSTAGATPFPRPQQKSMLRTALCPKTPLLRMRQQAFFTYRNTHADSPVIFDLACNEELNSSNRSVHFDTPSYKERHIKISDPEKGLEMIGRELAKEQQVEWREYWDFLNAFIDIASPEGLQKLENYFAQRIKEEEMSKKAALSLAQSAVILDDVCSALEKFGFSNNINSGSGAGISNNAFATRNGYYNERSRYAKADATATAAPQSTTPYTCVEKSLQVFAKRMTKTTINNIENVVSINDTLLSELKRLKSLICSFKEDARFHNVNFAKVHSRIGNLVSIYLANSQEVTPPIKTKIKNIIQNLLLTPGDRREHLECVCTRILNMLSQSTEQILPEHLKTEEMCTKVWLQEQTCDCQWENNLSRKTSRRNRMEARYKTHQDAKILEKAAKCIDAAQEQLQALDAWRNAQSSGTDSSDELEDDVFWSDFGGTDTEDDDDAWFTPAESPTSISLFEDSEDDSYKNYIYGTEPTKRDLDVLNAIFHIDIDKTQCPCIHAWKAALLRYPNEEMDYFPSPAVIKKTHSFTIKRDTPLTPLTTKKAIMTNLTPHGIQTQFKTQQQQQQQLPIAKRLFMSTSPARVVKTTHDSNTKQQQHKAPVTPLNKIRGLYTAYRERLDSSPMSASSASSPAVAFSSECSSGSNNSSDPSNNLSLLNVSAME